MSSISCSVFAEVRSLLGNKDVVMIAVPSREVSLAVLWQLIATQLAEQAIDGNRLQEVLASSAVAVNEEFVFPDDFASTMVSHTDAVAIIPPVSGG
jgi:molybdopterin converting factor small subunit